MPQAKPIVHQGTRPSSQAIKWHDRLVARDRIQFRRVATQDAAYGDSVVDVVEAYINGRALIDLWSRASGEGGRWMRAADAFWPGHRLWTDDPPPSSELAEGERRVVLLCQDGLTGCGGATARIQISEQTVEWGDFHTVPAASTVPLGPFVFDRTEYERALAEVASGRR